ncbi:MAG: hypothetical protein BJ554DRAFT_7532, partial [Olpidium bornovanus]
KKQEKKFSKNGGNGGNGDNGGGVRLLLLEHRGVVIFELCMTGEGFDLRSEDLFAAGRGVELLQAKLRIAELEKEELELELKVSDDDDGVNNLFTGNLQKTNTTVVKKLVLSDSESEDEGDLTVGDALPEPLAFVLPDGPLNTVLSEELQERLVTRRKKKIRTSQKKEIRTSQKRFARRKKKEDSHVAKKKKIRKSQKKEDSHVAQKRKFARRKKKRRFAHHKRKKIRTSHKKEDSHVAKKRRVTRRKKRRFAR